MRREQSHFFCVYILRRIKGMDSFFKVALIIVIMPAL